MKFKVSILEYLGKIADGILALISVVYEEKYYEGTFFYNSVDMVLTVSTELEEVLGHSISDDIEYVNFLKEILKRIVPYDQLINSIDPIDIKRWQNPLTKMSS